MRPSRMKPLKSSYRFLRPWLITASIWLACSLTILDTYLERVGNGHLKDLCFLMSMLWMQFGFAAMFHTLLKQRGRHLLALILVTALPPLLLYFIVFSPLFGPP